MISLADIRAAQQRLQGVIHTTPLLYSKTLSEMSGNEIYLKCENLQKTGSFKIRGAYNAAASLSDAARAAGVVTGSSGNHGQALAYAGKVLGIRAVVVMPLDASKAKIAACRGYGGEVILCGYTSEDRLAKAKELVEADGLTMVHPYDDPVIMAGQGTIGLELIEQLPDLDMVVVQVGGGGLISGIATAIKETKPTAKVLGIEPALSPRLRYSWEQGAPTELEQWAPSVADGIRTKKPGTLGFEVTRRYVDDLVTVEEDEIITATKLVLERAKLLAEPSGAATVAAALSGKLGVQGKKIVCVISGGNIELARLAQLIG